MARILITGVSGLLGLNLAQEKMDTHEVIGVDRSKLTKAPFKVLKMDLLNPGAVDSILDSAEPNWGANCAALADINPSEEAPVLSRLLNTHLPAQLERACVRRGIRLVSVSKEAMSKYQLGIEVARKCGLKEGQISPRSIHTSNLIVKRSHNLSLSTNKVVMDLGTPLPEFSTGLNEFFAQYEQGYPQKIRSYQQ